MKMFKLLGTVAAAAAALAAGQAQASLTSFQTLAGAGYNMSTAGCGSTTQACSLAGNVPVGATVVAAYLYTSTFSGGVGSLTGTLNGTAIGPYTSLGANGGLIAGRTDVTAIVTAGLASNVTGTYSFRVTESSANQDGEALVIVFSDGTAATNTIGILDGFSASAGDNFTLGIQPWTATSTAQMRLGIGFSFDGTACSGGSQTSRVTVNTTVITNNAGCNDDSIDATPNNGNLITMGDDNDAFSGPLPSIAADHEKYNLAAQLALGDTSINVNTLNPSNDDNIFLAVFKLSGQATVCTVNCTVPEPAPLALVGLALTGLALQRKFAKRA